jgi:hypothetical protein
MYVGVVSVLIEGTVELDARSGVVSADSDLSARLIDIPSDHTTFSGADCDLESIDLIASMFTDMDFTSWVDGAMLATSEALATQYETEISYYVDRDCSEY